MFTMPGCIQSVTKSFSTVSMPSAGVEISGGMVNSTVVFMALGRMEVSHNVQINDDDVALENEEQFEIRLTGSNPSSEVMLGPSTEVTIYDDDGRLREIYY